jgi:hypothetical protein
MMFYLAVVKYFSYKSNFMRKGQSFRPGFESLFFIFRKKKVDFVNYPRRPLYEPRMKEM